MVNPIVSQGEKSHDSEEEQTQTTVATIYYTECIEFFNQFWLLSLYLISFDGHNCTGMYSGIVVLCQF